MKRDPLNKAEQLAVADELMASSRHDGRNRLAAIRNAAFYLQRRVSKTELWTTDARVEQFFRLIEESVGQVDALFGARPSVETSEPRACALAAAVERAVNAARVDAGIRFDVSLDRAEIRAELDELSLAVRCLLENAAEAMAQVGVVRVKGELCPPHYKLEVSDAGAPSAMEQDEMLKPLCSTKPGHLGLGLNIARRIAARSQGVLEIAKTAEGTRVTLTFPIALTDAENETDPVDLLLSSAQADG